MPTGPMMRSGFADLMFPGLNKVYMLTANSYPEEYTTFFNMDTSSQRQEEDAVVAGFGLVPAKDEGDSPQFDAMVISDKLQYLHTTYMLGFEVTEEMYEDELYGIIKKAPAALATATKQTIDTLGVTVLDRAFNSSYTGVDGIELCSTSHTRLKVGGTVANKPSVDVDLDPTSLNAALQTIEQWTDENGLPMRYMPKKILSGVPNRKMIFQMLGSQKTPFSADNEPNFLNDWDLEGTILHYLSDTDAWFIQCSEHFLRWFWRIRPRFRGYDDPNTGNARYYVRFRASSGFTHWPGMYGSSGA